MSTFTRIYYHIVFSTKYRDPCLTIENREKLFKYIWGIINKKDCHLYRINGVEDHIHILTDLKSNISLADFVKDIKVASSIWIKNQNIFPAFEGWQEGYAAFTCGSNDKDMIINYIKNQEVHHRKRTYLEEVERFLEENEIDYDSRYLV